MSTSILATKLYIPPPRRNAVARPRLHAQLDGSLHQKLTLIAAPAGYGKTTVVSAWVATCGCPAAWLSLDEGDNDPIRFLTYLVAALQTIHPSVGGGLLTALQSPQPPSAVGLLTALLNQIATVASPFLLVLDDYHLIETRAVDQALTFLLEHLPPQMHLLIISRTDPDLPLARYRARGQLTEVRAADLRFTPAEAADFLNGVMGLHLAPDAITALESRTEGWVAGLQMAALSLQGRSDSASFIQSFTGSHRFVLDYLLEEVLQRQPAAHRRFLLQTAFLDRLCGPLCDAVLGMDEERRSAATLAALERANLFLVPLDDQRHWYRYHHLFANVLQARLMVEMPEQVPALHRQASLWYEQHDYPYDAIRHALVAVDFDRAATLIQRAWPVMRQSYPDATLLGWVSLLPATVLRARPVLSVYYANALIAREPHAAEDHLGNAEEWLVTAAKSVDGAEASALPLCAAATAVVTDEEFRSLPGMVAFARAYQANALSHRARTVQYARQALDLLPTGDYFWRGATAVLLGLAHWHNGDLAVAHQSLVTSLSMMQRAGNHSAVVSTAYLLADVEIAQGCLRQAGRTAQQALKRVDTETDNTDPFLHNERKFVPQGTADLYVLLGEVACEQNALPVAIAHLQRSKNLGEYAILPLTRHRWSVVMARIQAALGEWESALAHLDEAERLQIEAPAPDVRPIAALRAQLWTRQGRVGEALAWLRTCNLSVDDELNYLHEFEHLTLVRILLAHYRNERTDGAILGATRLLTRLRKAAEATKRTASLLEILLLQALVYQEQGAMLAALAALHQALTLAEPEGYAQIFLDEGAPLAHLLSAAAAQGRMPPYASIVQAQLATKRSQQEGQWLVPTSTLQPSVQPLVEPLTPREYEVLQMIAAGSSNREIATALIVSITTVKTHVKHIYAKLQVCNRFQAIARAKALHLLNGMPTLG